MSDNMDNNLWRGIWRAIASGPRCQMCNTLLLHDEMVAGRCVVCDERMTEICPCCCGKGRLEIILGSVDDR